MAPLSPAAPAPISRPDQPLPRRVEIALALLPALLALAVFTGSISGGWVYDDEQLILRNTLVQEDRHTWTALTSDLFAVRSTAGEAASPYWRPAVVLWYIVSHRLFGLVDTAPWHAANIVLNALVTFLSFLLMRRLGIGALGACAGACLLAVHPTRVETVAWISGLPDLLLAAGLLGSLLLVLRITDGTAGLAAESVARPRRRWALWAAALALYALALGSKEIAVLFPALVFVASLVWRPASPPDAGPARIEPASWRRAALLTAPFIVLAIAYVVARSVILRGSGSVSPPGAVATTALSLPMAGWFYLRQAIFPRWIGPAYAIGPVAHPGLHNFVLPLVAVATAAAAMAWAAIGPWRSRAALVGLSLFLIGMALPGLVGWLEPDRMVQDRYLYLPLIGAVTLLIAAAARLLRRRGIAQRRAEAGILVGALVACAGLAAQTIRYVPAWGSDLALWVWGVRAEPSSRYAWSQLGTYLLGEEKYDEAAAALDRSLAIEETPLTLLNRAGVSVRQGQYDQAEAMLVRVLDGCRHGPPALLQLQTTELLARVYLERDDDVDRTIALFREVQGRLPAARALISARIASILDIAGRSDEALAELESARPHAARERIPQSAMALYRLGEQYARRGRLADARGAFEEFLRLTDGVVDEQMIQARTQAEAAADAIRRQGK